MDCWGSIECLGGDCRGSREGRWVECWGSKECCLGGEGLGVEESLCVWKECLEVKVRGESWGVGEGERVRAGEQMGELLDCGDGEREMRGLFGGDSASSSWVETILDAIALAFSLPALFYMNGQNSLS